jgi:hypothetical protein
MQGFVESRIESCKLGLQNAENWGAKKMNLTAKMEIVWLRE